MILRNFILALAAIFVVSFSCNLFAERLTADGEGHQLVTKAATNGNNTISSLQIRDNQLNPPASLVMDTQSRQSAGVQENLQEQVSTAGSDWFGYAVGGALVLVLAGFVKRSVTEG